MKKTMMSAALICLPMAALAMPVVGDVVGTNAADATTALAAKGCTVAAFEAEAGKIEAKCTDEAKKMWEVYIDPKTGAVTQVKDEAE